MSNYDVAVIGAGHNGLAAAIRLAKANKKVVVLEAREEVGGLCARRPLGGGYFAPGVHHDTDCLREGIVDALGLGAHGLQISREEVPTLSPDGSQPGLLVYRDPSRATAELGDDAQAYAAWRTFIGRIRSFLLGVLDAPPPVINAATPAEFIGLGLKGLALRRLGKADMVELLRVVPMPAADWVRETMKSPRLCALLAAEGLIGTHSGPHSAGTAANLLFHAVTARHFGVTGGPAAVIDALEASAKAAGVEIRTQARVSCIETSGGRVTGVTLDGGETLAVEAVASSAHPKHTMMELVPAAATPMRVEDQFRVIRSRGTVTKIHLALDGPFEVAGRENMKIERLRTGAHVDDVERAFDAVKYGELPADPHLDVRVFSGDGIAPAGGCVVSIMAGFTPYTLDGPDTPEGWTDAVRDAFADRVIKQLSEHAPGFEDRIVVREALSPRDLELQYGLTGGQLHHGEPGLDQLLFMRPAPCAAHYATPVTGLYLCGSGSHPGGGVTAAPGVLSATTLLEGARK